MVKTRRGTVLRSRAETSGLVVKKRSSKRLREEDTTKTLQSPTGADSAAIIVHQLGDVDSCVDVDLNGSDQSTIKFVSRPVRKRAVHTRKTPYRKQPVNQDSKGVKSVIGIQDLTAECLVAIFERVEDESYVRLVMPLVCKRWASILSSPSDVYKRITLETTPQEDFGVDPQKIAKWLAPRAGGLTCFHLAIPKKPFTESSHLAKFLEATLPHVSTSLTSLSIAARISCFDIAYIVQHAKHLTHLELSCLEADLDKRKLRQLSGLRELIHVVIRVEDTFVSNRSHGRRNECPILGSVAGLPKLKTVSIAYSTHADDNSYLLPGTVGRLTSLEKLSLENSLVLRLPEEFTLLKNIKELNFTWSRCCDFLASQKTWDSFGRLPNLECLTLHRCCIDRWPTINKHQLARLTRLVLTGSMVSWLGSEGFPKGFFPYLPNLQELVLRSSSLPALPNDIFTLEKLKYLDVSDNYLVDMPLWEIGLPKLKSLKTLKAGNNPFPALPRRFILGCPFLENILMEHCENLEMSASINWLVDGSTSHAKIERKVIDIHKQSHRFQESSKRWINELQTKVRGTALKLYYGDLTEYEKVHGKNGCGCI